MADVGDIAEVGGWIIGGISADEEAENLPDVEAMLRSAFEDWLAKSSAAQEIKGMTRRDFLLSIEVEAKRMGVDPEVVLPRAEWEEDEETRMQG